MTPLLTQRQAAMCLLVLDYAIDRMREASCNDLDDEVLGALTASEWSDLTSRLGLGEVNGDDVQVKDYEVLEAVRREIRAIAGQDEARQGGDQ